MKSLEITTNKRLLIVEYATEAARDTEIGLISALTPTTIIYLGKMLKPICSGYDLTEEKIRELNIVETKPYGSPPGFCTIAYQYGVGDNGFRPGFCAPNGKQFTNSFISAIEAQGWYWGENPKQKDFDRGNEYTDMFTIAARVRALEGAESRTFHPEKCLIFEIVEGQS